MDQIDERFDGCKPMVSIVKLSEPTQSWIESRREEKCSATIVLHNKTLIKLGVEKVVGA
jgi:hypothetical protein